MAICTIQKSLSHKPGAWDSQSSLTSDYPGVTLTMFFPGEMKMKTAPGDPFQSESSLVDLASSLYMGDLKGGTLIPLRLFSHVTFVLLLLQSV